MNFTESNWGSQIYFWQRLGKPLVFTLAFLIGSFSQTTIAQENAEVAIWPQGLPAGAADFDAEKAKALIAATKVHPQGHILFVDTPTITVYPASSELANGAAVVVCPGGGYNVLAWQHEGVDLARWLNSMGVTAFILKYRVPRRSEDNMHWEPMQDVQRAIRMVRHDAEKYKVDANRIGVLGFSAGGHLTIMAAVGYDTQCYQQTDEIDAVSARPDFVCPIYAAYLGDDYRDDKAELGPLVTITPQTPPMFMAVTWGDKMRGAQSALLLARLKEHNVPSELHVYQNGGHGYGIRKSEMPVAKWHHHLANWLKFNGYFEANVEEKMGTKNSRN